MLSEYAEDSKKSSVLSGYRLFQVLYVQFFFASLRSPSYNLRRQINRPFQELYVQLFLSSLCSPSYRFEQQLNRPNCTISSVLCQILLGLDTLALIQF
jgi:hypothetical protein